MDDVVAARSPRFPGRNARSTMQSSNRHKKSIAQAGGEALPTTTRMLLSVRRITRCSRTKLIASHPSSSWPPGVASLLAPDESPSRSFMLTQHIALVPEVAGINASELARVSAALQKQMLRDFSPIWQVAATVDPF